MGRENKIANVVVNLAMGGIERLSIQLCAHLNRDKFDPTLICIEGGGPLENEAAEYGVNVVKLAANAKNVPGAVYALSKILRELNVDVVQGNPGLIARLAAPKGAAIISTYHNTLMGRGYFSLLPDRYLARRTDILVGITKNVAVNAETALRLPPDTFRVIYNGVDIGRIRRLALAAGKGVEKGGRAVCFIGRLAFEKGVDVLIEAFGLVTKEVENVFLWIIGDGPERADLELLAAGTDGPVIFWGRQVNPYILLSKAEICCVPSLEGPFELVIPEAMALGLPVIASRTGGIPEVVGDAGLLTEPGDAYGLATALVGVLTDERTAQNLSEKSLDRAEYFDIGRMADEYGQIYEEVVSRRL
jgi:glycosyltransferase involved in cell wall biosynthesis